MISIQNVHKSFGDLEVLKGVSLDVQKGEVLSIIGVPVAVSRLFCIVSMPSRVFTKVKSL